MQYELPLYVGKTAVESIQTVNNDGVVLSSTSVKAEYLSFGHIKTVHYPDCQ